jgi:hypothetical protein
VIRRPAQGIGGTVSQSMTVTVAGPVPSITPAPVASPTSSLPSLWVKANLYSLVAPTEPPLKNALTHPVVNANAKTLPEAFTMDSNESGLAAPLNRA